MISEFAQDAFYEGKRSEKLPFALNDSVVALEGTKCGVGAAVISLESEKPEAVYRIEYGDNGSMDVLPASKLKLHEN